MVEVRGGFAGRVTQAPKLYCHLERLARGFWLLIMCLNQQEDVVNVLNEAVAVL